MEAVLKFAERANPNIPSHPFHTFSLAAEMDSLATVATLTEEQLEEVVRDIPLLCDLRSHKRRGEYHGAPATNISMGFVGNAQAGPPQPAATRQGAPALPVAAAFQEPTAGPPEEDTNP